MELSTHNLVFLNTIKIQVRYSMETQTITEQKALSVITMVLNFQGLEVLLMTVRRKKAREIERKGLIKIL